MNPTMLNEQLSALADGQLQGEEFARMAEQLGAHGELRTTWHTWHLVGDVLRTGAHSPCSDPALFLARIQQRLVGEPLPSADGSTAAARPIAVEQPPLPLAPRVMPMVQRAEAANAPVFRWKLVAGLASLVAVAAIGWNWLGLAPGMPGGTELAQAQPPQAPRQQPQLQPQPAQQVQALLPGLVPATGTGSVLDVADVPRVAANPQPGPARVVIGNGRPQLMLRDPRLDELLAAHQQAGGASQMPSGFLRNATFEDSGR